MKETLRSAIQTLDIDHDSKLATSRLSVERQKIGDLLPTSAQVWCFTIALYFMLAPNVYSIYQDLRYGFRSESSGERLSKETRFIFVANILLLFMGVKVFVRTFPVKFKHKTRSTAQLLLDVAYTCVLFGIFIWKILEVQGLNDKDVYAFIQEFTIRFVVYVLAFEFSDSWLKISVDSNLISSPAKLVVFSVGGSVVLAQFVFHLYHATLLIHIMLWISLFVPCFSFYILATKFKCKIHIHHYFYPIVFLPLVALPHSEASKSLLTLTTTMSLHGTSFFGVEPLAYFPETKAGKHQDNSH